MATIKSIKPRHENSFNEIEIKDSLNALSIEEKSQLQDEGYPSPAVWCQLRDFLVRRSMVSNTKLSPDMTAYTPSETLELMDKKPIKEWLDNIENLKIPDSAKIVMFVPCAKTKPWKDAPRGIYKSYNKIIKENKDDIYFVTISEPLGVVPQENWENFPQYDNPGLFKDVVQRSGGLFTKDWKENFGVRYKMPWSQNDYDKVIDILADKISIFINNNEKIGREFISFVGDNKTIGTHQDMVNRSKKILEKNQFLKRAAPREEPYEYIKEKLEEIKNNEVVNFLKNKTKNSKKIPLKNKL
jgi:predicted RNA-binding protein